ncbi:hypothetical protein BASA83_004475 [Batrachochytrium salamandrivorans]|nr:hypothetical protein BASA83_004475 [Batrachochytrium salamandrivorans]
MKEQYEMMNCLFDAERFYCSNYYNQDWISYMAMQIGIAYLRSSVRWRKDDSFRRTRVEDLIFDYGSETEQAQQMGKKEEMYFQYTNFVIKANHNKDRRIFAS